MPPHGAHRYLLNGSFLLFEWATSATNRATSTTDRSTIEKPAVFNGFPLVGRKTRPTPQQRLVAQFKGGPSFGEHPFFKGVHETDALSCGSWLRILGVSKLETPLKIIPSRFVTPFSDSLQVLDEIPSTSWGLRMG